MFVRLLIKTVSKGTFCSNPSVATTPQDYKLKKAAEINRPPLPH